MLKSSTAPEIDVPVATAEVENGTLSIHTVAKQKCFAAAVALTQRQEVSGQPVCLCPPAGAHDPAFQRINPVKDLGDELGPHVVDGVLTVDRPVIVESRDCAILTLWAKDCPEILICHIGRDGLVRRPDANGGAKPTSVCLAAAALGKSNVAPGQMRAWIGPTICPICFRHDDGTEQTEAIRARFRGQHVNHFDETIGGIDIQGIITNLLVGWGVPPHRITRAERCTSCDETLASLRRDGAEAQKRNYAVIIPKR